MGTRLIRLIGRLIDRVLVRCDFEFFFELGDTYVPFHEQYGTSNIYFIFDENIPLFDFTCL